MLQLLCLKSKMDSLPDNIKRAIIENFIINNSWNSGVTEAENLLIKFYTYNTEDMNICEEIFNIQEAVDYFWSGQVFQDDVHIYLERDVNTSRAHVVIYPYHHEYWRIPW